MSDQFSGHRGADKTRLMTEEELVIEIVHIAASPQLHVWPLPEISLLINKQMSNNSIEKTSV